MRRNGGGGFGFVMILLVMVIVMFVALRNWRAVAPEALEIQKHNKDRAARGEVPPEQYAPDSGKTSPSASADSWTPAPPSRPSLSTMEERTTAHSNAVQDTANQAN